jgi:hypothetical protein
MSEAAVWIEPTGEKDTGVCACCGRSSKIVWGFAYSGRDCLAAYQCHWTVGHVADVGANFDMIIGAWGEAATAKTREAVCLAYWVAETGPSFMVIDATTRPIAESELVGRALTREQVIGTPLAQRAFAIADAVLAHDQRVSEILCGWRVET